MVQVGSILGSHALPVELVVVVVHVLVIFLVLMIEILKMVVYIIGSGAVYGRGVLVDGGSSSGADGSGHVGCQAKFLVMVQVIVRMVLQV